MTPVGLDGNRGLVLGTIRTRGRNSMKSLPLFPLLTIVALPLPAADAEETRSIKVSARSEIKVVPDEVVLDLAVHHRHADLLLGKRNNDDVVAAVLELAKQYKIPAKDVQLSSLWVDADYGSRYGSRSERTTKPIAYDIVRGIEVKLVDFSKIESFLYDAFKAGMNDVRGIEFRISSQREYQFKARKLAVTFAREKAEHLTELTGMKLGMPIHIDEGVEWTRGGSAFGGFGGSSFEARHEAPSESDESPSRPNRVDQRRDVVLTAFQGEENKPVHKSFSAPGQIIVSATVTIEFEISAK